jgi:hypothetical protein
MTRKPLDKKPARNLFLIFLVTGIFLILWLAMSNSTNPNRESLSLAILKETFQSFEGVPRIDSSTKAVLAAQSIFDPRVKNKTPPQVLDVRLLIYREAITRVNDINAEGADQIAADLPVWVVIFYSERIDGPVPGTNPGSLSGVCTYVFVDPQKGTPFQSGFLEGCHW